jgi:hypothetical protein
MADTLAAITRACSAVMSRSSMPPAWYAAAEGRQVLGRMGDRLLNKLPPASVRSKTRRTLTAVYLRRAALGINNGRTTRHQ